MQHIRENGYTQSSHSVKVWHPFHYFAEVCTKAVSRDRMRDGPNKPVAAGDQRTGPDVARNCRVSGDARATVRRSMERPAEQSSSRSTKAAPQPTKTIVTDENRIYNLAKTLL